MRGQNIRNTFVYNAAQQNTTTNYDLDAKTELNEHLYDSVQFSVIFGFIRQHIEFEMKQWYKILV